MLKQYQFEFDSCRFFITLISSFFPGAFRIMAVYEMLTHNLQILRKIEPLKFLGWFWIWYVGKLVHSNTIIPCNLPITLQQTIIHSCKVIINVLCSEYLCSWKLLIYQRRGKEIKTERKKRRGNQTWVICHLNYCRDEPKPNYFGQTFFLHWLLLFQQHCYLQGDWGCWKIWSQRIVKTQQLIWQDTC